MELASRGRDCVLKRRLQPIRTASSMWWIGRQPKDAQRKKSVAEGNQCVLTPGLKAGENPGRPWTARGAGTVHGEMRRTAAAVSAAGG
jgi:hypothetical protein